MTGRIPLDLETGSADDLYRLPPTPSYIRLIGRGQRITPGTYDTLLVRQPTVTVNGHLFDFPALDRHAGIPVEQTIPFSRDLRVAAFQHDPPTTYQTKPGPGFRSYSLDALGERYLGVPKSTAGRELAKEYGGWDNIPVDDPRYAEYCRADLELTRRLDAAIPYDPYEQREAWVATVLARATLQGCRVDVSGLTERVRQLDAQAAAGRSLLASHGFPLTLADGSPAKAPQRTRAGKEALETALAAAGFPVERWPRGKDGTLSLSKEVMAHALEHAEGGPARPVIAAVAELNGVRNNSANLLRCTTSAGLVHPQFLPFQSTGRWSVLEPGLTVLKKGTADSERAFILPDTDDEVLISVDLDQIDIRSVAAHSQDPALIALLNDPERDIHNEIAQLSGVPRQAAKTLDLGWLYGRTVNGLAQTPGMTRGAAERVSSAMASSYGTVMAWQRGVRERGEAGVLLDNGLGRRLRVDPERAFTQAPALVGQSTTRDIIAEGMLDLARTAPDLARRIRIVVHDEVVCSVPRRDAEEAARTVQACMSRMWAPAGCSIPVSITAGQNKPVKTGTRWHRLYM